jgi:hypothetical protein
MVPLGVHLDTQVALKKCPAAPSHLIAGRRLWFRWFYQRLNLFSSFQTYATFFWVMSNAAKRFFSTTVNGFCHDKEQDKYHVVMAVTRLAVQPTDNSTTRNQKTLYNHHRSWSGTRICNWVDGSAGLKSATSDSFSSFTWAYNSSISFRSSADAASWANASWYCSHSSSLRPIQTEYYHGKTWNM